MTYTTRPFRDEDRATLVAFRQPGPFRTPADERRRVGAK